MAPYCPNPQCPDRLHNGVPGEYRDGTVHCPYCGTVLNPGEAPRERAAAGGVEGGGTTSTEVTVFLAQDPTEAAMIAGLLEQHGIPSFQRVEGLHGDPAFFSARWAPVPGQRYEIVVAPASERKARQLLEDTLGPEAGATHTTGGATPAPPPTSRLEGRGRARSDHRILVLLVVLASTFLATAIAWILQTVR